MTIINRNCHLKPYYDLQIISIRYEHWKSYNCYKQIIISIVIILLLMSFS